MSNPLKAIALSALSVLGIRTTGEPVYDITDRVGQIEIRSYAPRFAAETTVQASTDGEARSLAFKILAGYIFGGNRARHQIEMTAPVQTIDAKTFAMTAPVQAESSKAGVLTMRFFMPPDVTPGNAPIPHDDRVKLVDVPAETIAVLRYSGSWTPEIISARTSELLSALAQSPWKASGGAFSQFYDPPFTLPPLRRNEAAVRVSL